MVASRITSSYVRIYFIHYVMDYIDGVSVMKNIERAGRTCYKSEVLSNDSYKKFIKSIITRGHESVLEHEKITVRLVTDRGTMWDITRHSHASFSIESSRYCNYSKDKFGNEINFIKPCNIEDGSIRYTIWEDCMKQIENSYNAMAMIEGTTVDQLRMLLPHSTAGEVYMTANMREWRHIFQLRADKHAHPSVQQMMIPLLLHFKSKMPELFNDIGYNEDFNQQDYAEIKLI